MNFSVIVRSGAVSTKVEFTLSYGPDFAALGEKSAHLRRETSLSSCLSY